jgi:phosphatidylserine/phosphatidylglycerophosphate/cardiolipin synthase-like enzyme
MKIVVAVFFLVGLFQAPVDAAETEAYFSPEEGIKEIILKEVEASTSTIDLAILEITSPDMARALLNAKQRGVKVRIIADSRHANSKPSQITYLIRGGIPVKVLGGAKKGVMNHRFVILDGARVITGSYGWTEASERWNYENILVLEKSEAVTSYQKEFERLWREKRVIK